MEDAPRWMDVSKLLNNLVVLSHTAIAFSVINLSTIGILLTLAVFARSELGLAFIAQQLLAVLALLG